VQYAFVQPRLRRAWALERPVSHRAIAHRDGRSEPNSVILGTLVGEDVQVGLLSGG